jgi:predicted cobalt transporter CbtA
MCEQCQVDVLDRGVSLAKRVGAALCALLWSSCGYFGAYVDPAQRELYVVFPVAMTLLGIGLVVFSRRATMALYVVLLALEVVLILPFLSVCWDGA